MNRVNVVGQLFDASQVPGAYIASVRKCKYRFDIHIHTQTALTFPDRVV